VLHFARPGGWRCVTNFGPGPVPLPHGTVIRTSVPVEGSQLPVDTTAWLIGSWLARRAASLRAAPPRRRRAC